MDSMSSVLAFGASKIEGAGHTPQTDIREPHNNVRINARLETPRGLGNEVGRVNSIDERAL